MVTLVSSPSIHKLLPITKMRSLRDIFIHTLHVYKCSSIKNKDLIFQITLQCLRWGRWPRPDLCRGFAVLSQ